MTTLTGPLGLIRRIAGAVTAALTVALIAHFASVALIANIAEAGVIFNGQRSASGIMSLLSDYFLSSTLVLFVLLALVAGFDGFRRWYVAAPLVILMALLAGLFGGIISLLGKGITLDGVAITGVFQDLIGPLHARWWMRRKPTNSGMRTSPH